MHDDGFYGIATLRRYKNAVREAAELDHVWFKDVRRTFGVRTDQSGLSMKKLQMIMGHKKRETTIRYTHHQVMLALEDAWRVVAQIEAA